MNHRWLGRVGYADALAMQNDLHARRVAGLESDTLLHLEHDPVFSVGRRGSRDEIVWSPSEIAAHGVEVVDADRGGQVTFHGPGQLVGYPILSLGLSADLVGYVRRIEAAIIACLADYGIDSGRDPRNSGVWVGDAKIASIGVKVSRGVTKHGYAINVTTDLSYFSGIVACGMPTVGLVSMQTLGIDATLEDVAIKMHGHLEAA